MPKNIFESINEVQPELVERLSLEEGANVALIGIWKELKRYNDRLDAAEFDGPRRSGEVAGIPGSRTR